MRRPSGGYFQVQGRDFDRSTLRKAAGVNISVHFRASPVALKNWRDELIHSDRFGPAISDRTVLWLGDCDVSHGGGDIIRRDGLHHTR